MDKLTPETVRAARDAGPPKCVLCGHAEYGHYYRHAFEPSHAPLEDMAYDLATAHLAMAEENERLRKRIEAADQLADQFDQLIQEYLSELHDTRDGVWLQSDFDEEEDKYRPFLATYRATGGQG